MDSFPDYPLLKITLPLALHIPPFLVYLYLLIYLYYVDNYYLFTLFIVYVLPPEFKLQGSRGICVYIAYFYTLSTWHSAVTR